jgi:hypothetical protein
MPGRRHDEHEQGVDTRLPALHVADSHDLIRVQARE